MTLPAEPPNEPAIPYVTFSRAYDNTPKPITQSWPDLRDRLHRPMLRPTKDGPLWSPAVYRPHSTRGNCNVIEVTAAVLDFDGNASLDELIALSRGHTVLIHSTYSHTPTKPKYRVVLPLYSPVATRQWPEAWNRLNHFYNGLADKACKDAARIHYLPATSRERRQCFQVESFDGPLLSVVDLPPLPVVEPKMHKFTDRAYKTAYVHGAVRRARERVEMAAPGERHRIRLAAARNLGGFVPLGLITEDEIITALSVNFGPSRQNAIKAIIDGISYGIAAPHRPTND